MASKFNYTVSVYLIDEGGHEYDIATFGDKDDARTFMMYYEGCGDYLYLYEGSDHIATRDLWLCDEPTIMDVVPLAPVVIADSIYDEDMPF